MLSSIPTPVLLILAVVIGLLIGLLAASLLNREPKISTDAPLPEKYTKNGYAEAARILYSPAAKKVVTFLDGDYYDDFATLTPEQKRRVTRLLESWNEWGGVTPTSTAPAAAPNGADQLRASLFDTPAAIPAAAAISAVPEKKIPPLPVVNINEFTAKPESLEDLGIEVPKIVEPIPQVIKFGGTTSKLPPEKPKTIVDQINEKLEQIIAGTPNANRGIRLEDNGHQGVIVWVGLSRYEGVDQVTDPEVHALIKKAVARWEEDSEN
jgi:hypothetical protein